MFVFPREARARGTPSRDLLLALHSFKGDVDRAN
jgi:hypothetical protein